MKKKNILISSYNLDFGGIETSLINLLKNFDYDKYNVTLVLEKKEGVFLNDLPKCVTLKEYRTNTCSNVLVRKAINLLKRIKWMMFNYKRYDASICYATYSGPCGFVARTAANNKTLYVHSNYYEAFNKDKNKTKEFFDNLKIEKYNHIVFVSNESKKDLCSIYPDIENKAVTINNLIDYKRIIKLSEKKIDIKKTNKKVFLFVGRLDESSKRLTLLLEVAKKCKEEKISSIFWIIGNGPDEKMYKNIVKKEKLDNVLFFGSKKNPYPYIKASDYLILTSRYEGFPVVYNEAITLNKPILTTVNVSDDFITIPNRFGIILNKDTSKIVEEIKNIIKADFKIKEQVDFDKLNKERVSKIMKLMENNND